MKENKITLPIIIKSRNVLDREHWAVKRRTQQEYQVLIRNQMRLNKTPLAKKEKYNLLIQSYRKKMLDFDNLVGGCKHLIDAMIKENFIYDDSTDYLYLKVEQYVGGEVYTRIKRTERGKDEPNERQDKKD